MTGSVCIQDKPRLTSLRTFAVEIHAELVLFHFRDHHANNVFSAAFFSPCDAVEDVFFSLFNLCFPNSQSIQVLLTVQITFLSINWIWAQLGHKIYSKSYRRKVIFIG